MRATIMAAVMSSAIWFGSVAFVQTEPLDIVFVVDVGPGMADLYAPLAAGARVASYELSVQDRSALVVCSSSAKVISPLDDDPTQLSRAFQKTGPAHWRQKNSVRLYDGVALAITLFRPTDTARGRHIVVLTTDGDGGSRQPSENIIREATNEHISISFVVLVPASNMGIGTHSVDLPRLSQHPNEDVVAQGLRVIADKTGGKAVTMNLDGYVLRKVVSRLKDDSL